MPPNSWKLQDAKAKFSEVVRRARSGEPQQITVHGEEAVLIVDPKRYEIRLKNAGPPTTADFVEASRRFRGLDLKLPLRTKMVFREKKIFDDLLFDEDDDL